MTRTQRSSFLTAWTAFLPLLLVVASAPLRAGEVYEKGGVRFYPKAKRIEMDGKFCLAEGPIELLACAKGGKEYESVITLDMKPSVLHLCLLVMGLKPGETGPRFQGDPDRAPTGSRVIVKVKWKDGATTRVVRAEELCWNALDKRTMVPTPWVFVGSKTQKHPDTGKRVYWADIEKSVMTVYRDPFAVLDLPLALGANDEAYLVNKQVVPKVNTPCTVILEPGSDPAPPPANPEGGRVLHVDITAGGRVLVDGLEPANLSEMLRTLARFAPKDSCRVTLDHAMNPGAAAQALQAIDAAGLVLESVHMTRVSSGVEDVVALSVEGDRVTVAGKTVTDEQARVIVRGLAGRAGGRSGITVAVEKGARPPAIVRALRACEGAKAKAVRLVWKAGRMTATGKKPPAMRELPKNAEGGRIIPVRVSVEGRMSIAGWEPADAAETLKTIAWRDRKSTCQVTIDHGAPPKVVAKAFEAVWVAVIGIERIETVRLRPGVKDGVAVEVQGVRLKVDGERRTREQLATLITSAARRTKSLGVAIKVTRAASVRSIIKAVEACDAAENVVLRMASVEPARATPR